MVLGRPTAAAGVLEGDGGDGWISWFKRKQGAKEEGSESESGARILNCILHKR